MMLVLPPTNPIESPEVSTQARARRGATLMEYLMMLSLIITVCIIGVGYFGMKTNEVSSAASSAISKSVKDK
ncbi:MAG: hypothetical protein HYX68_15960 [Planctomycetes bacterium]|nr:hypothetical protein [Planctomycetota bacterium]